MVGVHWQELPARGAGGLQNLQSVNENVPIQVGMAGTTCAYRLGMGAKNINELRAYQRARAFKLEVYRLVDESPGAQRDWKFRSQLMEAAASNEMNVREGFRRFLAADMARFLSFALSSLSEALGWIEDGIDRRYFRKEDCVRALDLGEASDKTTLALHQSLQPFIRKRPRPTHPPHPPRNPK